KGSKVYLEGQLETRKWTDQSGVEKYSTEVVLRPYRGELTMLDSKGAGGGNFASGPQADYSAPAAANTQSAPIDELEDAISLSNFYSLSFDFLSGYRPFHARQGAGGRPDAGAASRTVAPDE